MVFQKIRVYLFSFFAIIFSLSCGGYVKAPLAEEGFLDARQFLENPSAVISLTGEWLYHPKIIVHPADVTLIDATLEPKYFSVPGVWSSSFLKRGFLSGDGFATFRLSLLHNLKNQPISFKIPEMETAYLLFVDGKQVAANGVVSSEELHSEPEYRPLIADFIPESDTSEIILQISNYHHRKGGPGQIISVGRTNQIHSVYEKEILKDMLLAGSIFFMGIYHFFLYLNRKKDPYTFWFAFACLLITIRVFVTGNKYITMLFPYLPWEFHLKLSYISVFLLTPIFGRYMYLMYRDYFSRNAFDIVFHFGIAISVLVLLTRSSFYTYLIVPYQLFTLGVSGYAIVIITKAIKAKQEGAILFLASFCVFVISILNDILVNNFIITTPLVSHYGIFMLFLFQSIVIGRNFSRGFFEAENLAKKLSEKNKDLEEVESLLTNVNERLEVKVHEKTKELQTRLDQIGKDLKLANSIVTSLIAVPDLAPHLQVRILFQPLAEIGGDIYSIKKINDNYVRFFLADATGHGLQAALYTMMIQSEFEKLNMVVTRPNDLLFYLNDHFYDKNSEFQIYFPAVVADFDLSRSLLRFSCAGMENHFIHKKGGQLVLLENSGPIIGILDTYRFGMNEQIVEEGDRIYLYTDGIFEELNENDGQAAIQELMEVIGRTRSLVLDEVIPFITEELRMKMQKHKWKDDVSLIIIEVSQLDKQLKLSLPIS